MFITVVISVIEGTKVFRILTKITDNIQICFSVVIFFYIYMKTVKHTTTSPPMLP